MTDSIELEAPKSPLVEDIRERLAKQGVDFDSSELRMGYTRTSTPLLGDIRTAAVIAIDHNGRVGEVVHMPLENLDPITLDEQIVVDVLNDTLWRDLGDAATRTIAHKIVVALRAGTTTKES